MKIEFYGVRGSPTPGKDTVIFGGNTSCVYVCLNDGNDVILDAGTGIIGLGSRLFEKENSITILLTHNHWDHIQGFPFFKPIYQPSRKISIITGAVDFEDKDMILKQMSGSSHPVKFDQLPADIGIDTKITLNKRFNIPGFTVETQALNHPDGGTAYCLYADGKKLAYVTDNELNTPTTPTTSRQQWLDFIADADVLIHDAQYTEDDLPLKLGWGHSIFEEVGRLAREANVKTLFIISHDPERKDDELLREEKNYKLSTEMNYVYIAQGKVRCLIWTIQVIHD
ncbi:MBL fold metallo-hydrolase [Colwellia sp. MSW7]|uniref:MBL fold metallo-hydrolase n=1 Tax=Colwellia maritima TaxID=2912588 RepID=A0ABS9X0T6_9GAMM|nr:MBL fold metallo-hydrolase [Colwellia maritima]MCI2283874.1 MBL fold metallo-hydrolase [Colwellia maritima]